MMNGNDSDASNVNEKQQAVNQTDGTSAIAQGELDRLLTSISSKDTTNNTLIEPESSNVNTNDESVYISGQKDVRDELAIGYAEEIVNVLPSLV